MKKLVSQLAVVAGVLAFAGSALAVPTLVIQDTGGGTINAINSSAGGIVTITTGDGLFTVVVSTGTAYPPLAGGTASAPFMDMTIQVTSAAGSQGSSLSLWFGGDNFGPTSSAFQAVMTGHMVTGTASIVSFSTWDNTLNGVPSLATPLPAGSTMLTSQLGINNSQVSSPVSLGSPYSLIEVVKINGSVNLASYSLDASITTVPDGGTTVAMLGFVFVGAEALRRKLRK